MKVICEWVAPRDLETYEADVILAAMVRAADDMLRRFDKMLDDARRAGA